MSSLTLNYEKNPFLWEIKNRFSIEPDYYLGMT